MDIVTGIIKLLFGSKADKDRKAIEPYVNKIKEVYPSIAALSNDELRGRSQALMKQINEASFAVDEAVLCLDPHPDCAQAMQYYQSAVGARKAAMDAYQSRFGPLLVDDVIGNTWTWVTEKWPWEGGC